jgi:hypothetical protein
MSAAHAFQTMSKHMFTYGRSELLVMSASSDTRADHLEVLLYTTVNHSPELSAERSSDWKRNAVRIATKGVVHLTDHDCLTVFF